jgi:IclR family KDG regulon transcriptional repressor
MNTTLLVAFDILKFLSERQGEYGLYDICKHLNMNKTTVFRYTETLISLYLLEKREGKFYLGLGLCELCSKVDTQYLIIDHIHPVLEDLAKEVNETVNLACIYDDTALYLDKVESTRSLQLKAAVGDKLPLYCTGVGKAILATLEPTRLESLLINLKLDKLTKYTITDIPKLEEEIELIRTRGYSIDQEEFDEGLVCAATPLKIPELNFWGGVSISGPISRLDKERTLYLADKLLARRDELLSIIKTAFGGTDDRG